MMLMPKQATLPASLPEPNRVLQDAIRGAGLAAWKVAFLAEVSPTALSHFCTGRRTPDAAQQARLAAVLGAPREVLFASASMAVPGRSTCRRRRALQARDT